MSEEQNAMAFRPPRLPFPRLAEDKYGVTAGMWRVLVEVVWPSSQSVESVGLALAYCKARNLDPLKRCIHIVPVWDSKQGRYIDTLWPGIAELRTTASRTKGYAGQDPAVYGDDIEKAWTGAKGAHTELVFPEWCQVTVYRIVKGVRCAFTGPRVYWLEEYAEKRGGLPNSMWQKRPRGQITKCAEAAALRVAFPEELGDEHTADSGPVIVQYGQNGARSEQLTCRSKKLLQEVNRGVESGNERGAVCEQEEGNAEATGLHGGRDDSGSEVSAGGVENDPERRGHVPEHESDVGADGSGDRSAVPERSQGHQDAAGFLRDPQNQGSDVRDSRVAKGQRKGGEVPKPKSVAKAEPENAGSDGRGGDDVPLSELEMPVEYMYWCPHCELGFDYDKKTTTKKIKNTVVACCPTCNSTDLQAWEDHVLE